MCDPAIVLKIKLDSPFDPAEFSHSGRQMWEHNLKEITHFLLYSHLSTLRQKINYLRLFFLACLCTGIVHTITSPSPLLIHYLFTILIKGSTVFGGRRTYPVVTSTKIDSILLENPPDLTRFLWQLCLCGVAHL